jgi:CheY-like chemotaxis protein
MASPRFPLTPRAGPGLSVLVVAADADAARSYAALLRVTGHRVRTAADDPGAAALAAVSFPDVAVIDLYPPGRPSAVVAALSGARQGGRRPLMLAICDDLPGEGFGCPPVAGLDVRLPKPVDPDALLGLLRRFERIVAPAPADNPWVADGPNSTGTSGRDPVPAAGHYRKSDCMSNR